MRKRISSTLMIACALSGAVVWLPMTVAAQDWQVQRLLAPSAIERAAERAGEVYIYDGLDERYVDQAVEQEFARLEHMMFVRVQRPAPEDDAEVPEDDCD